MDDDDGQDHGGVSVLIADGLGDRMGTPVRQPDDTDDLYERRRRACEALWEIGIEQRKRRHAARVLH